MNRVVLHWRSSRCTPERIAALQRVLEQHSTVDGDDVLVVTAYLRVRLGVSVRWSRALSRALHEHVDDTLCVRLDQPALHWPALAATVPR